MPPLKPFIYGTIAAVAAAAGGTARAELIKVSPFLPSASSAATPTANAPLEYRGAMEVSDVEQYRVVDPARKVGSWLKVGEHDSNLDVTIKQHDRDRETITIDHGGQTMTLSLHESKVIAGGGVPTLAAPPMAPNPMPNVSPAVVNTVVTNPTPADEQRRLEAVAAEVARRRALREQAQQGIQPGASVPTPAVTRQDLQQAQSMQQQRRQP